MANKRKKKVYVLYGVAKRDRTENVLMFFETKQDRADFARILPGSYDEATLLGIGYDDFEVDLSLR